MLGGRGFAATGDDNAGIDGIDGLVIGGVDILTVDAFVVGLAGAFGVLVDNGPGLVDDGPGLAVFMAVLMATGDDELGPGLRVSPAPIFLAASAAIEPRIAALLRLVAPTFGGCFVVSGEFRILSLRLTTFLMRICGSCAGRLLFIALILFALPLVDDVTPPSVVLLAFESTGLAVGVLVELAFEVAVLLDGFVITLVGMLE